MTNGTRLGVAATRADVADADRQLRQLGLERGSSLLHPRAYPCGSRRTVTAFVVNTTLARTVLTALGT